MMIQTAGGPGMVSPIDFHERKRPRFSKATLVALGIVVSAHVGLGAAMYYQRFEMPLITGPDLPDPIQVTFEPLPKPVPEPEPARTPPNTVFNETTAPPDNVEPITVIQGEKSAEESTTINVTRPAPEPVADAAPAEPVRQPPAVITNPSWSRQPSADQMTRAYPARAIAAAVAGSATLNCLVLPSGGVTDCNVTRETPGGYGFGRAAEGLSRHFRVNPRTVNGAAEGSRVNINLRFAPPET
jgi:protein TonB